MPHRKVIDKTIVYARCDRALLAYQRVELRKARGTMRPRVIIILPVCVRSERK